MTENNSFTFWSNMKETIDVYDDPVYKYKLYDALVEYGLYGVMPEDNGTIESKNIIAFIQSMIPSLDKSRNYQQKMVEAGATGGRKQKVTDEQIEEAIRTATVKKMGVPTRQEVVEALFECSGVKIDLRTLSRRCRDDQKKVLADEILRDIRDKTNVPGDKINVPGNGDKIGGQVLSLCPQGQNGDKIDVSGDKTNVPDWFNF